MSGKCFELYESSFAMNGTDVREILIDLLIYIQLLSASCGFFKVLFLLEDIIFLLICSVLILVKSGTNGKTKEEHGLPWLIQQIEESGQNRFQE